MNQLLERYGATFTDFIKSFNRLSDKKDSTFHCFVLPNKYKVSVRRDEDGFQVHIRKNEKVEIITFDSDEEVTNCLMTVMQR